MKANKEPSTKLNIGSRLRCIADMVGSAELLADVGTDHAYLPIYMLLQGRVDRAIVTDINAGPLERAVKNAALFGVSDRLAAFKTDGLSGIEQLCKDADGGTRYPDAVVIAGMGGELSARIISEADFLRDGKCRVILQPMTRVWQLRQALLGLGFEITDERLVRDGKLYEIITAVYTGKREHYSHAELLIGRLTVKKLDPLLAEHISAVMAQLQKSVRGLERSSMSETQKKRLDQLKDIQSELYTVAQKIGIIA